MMRSQGGWCSLPVALAFFLGSAAPPAGARPQDTSLESFEQVDPYTRGDAKLLAKLGYVSVAPTRWTTTQTTQFVRETLGGIDVLFLETAHFRIASTLATYEGSEDQAEKDQLEEELARLKRRCSRLKPQRDIDPWLRLHLYAQRLEDLYADFSGRFGLTEASFPPLHTGAVPMGSGPHLGQPEKFTVFLSDNESALGRYLTASFGQKDEFSFRWEFDGCYFLGVNAEALRHIERRHDVCLRTTVTGALVLNLVESFRGLGRNVPIWFTYGLAHFYAREIDPRWNNWSAGGNGNWETDQLWVWEPRVRALVANDFATSWPDMCAWRTGLDLKPQEHMIAWSKVRWLLDEKAEGLPELLIALSDPPPTEAGDERAVAVAHLTRAFQTAYDATPEELDREWAKYVQRKYPK